VYAVDPTATGVTLVSLSALDLTRRQSKVRFDGAPATLIGGHGGSEKAVASMLDHAALALAAEQTGAAGHLMQLCVEYAKVRNQFGRPIGAFQAIKHKLADMAFDVERMDSIIRHGAAAAATQSVAFPAIASTAKVFCSEAFFRIAAEAIQVHGGIGFTWEHQAHLYFRRAKSTEYLLGSPVKHRELLLQKLGV
jgi:alkylation response protein AidB-like acyl-CoA dehydrogenase